MKLNRKTMRAYEDADAALFGIACYHCEMATKNQVQGIHAGIVQSVKDAEKWINGEKVKIVQVYPGG